MHYFRAPGGAIELRGFRERLRAKVVYPYLTPTHSKMHLNVFYGLLVIQRSGPMLISSVYVIFMHFRQITVLNFGLIYSGSEPFI